MKKKTTTSKSLTVLGRSLARETSLGRRLYTVPQLIRLTGLTRKQVSYWSKTELLTPTLRDSKALKGQPTSFYSAVEVVRGIIFCELRRAGFSPRQVQQVATNLRTHDIQLDEPETYLLTDGYSVYYASSDNEVVDILKHHRQMLLLIPIHERIEKLMKVA